ncbi:EF-hand domain-containing protein [Kordiimonas aquimaris]|uniref:EF-hand domain-containing protein n=1 Tax=Kordiimonas aquimaris TaxID=707591 RepID=UPI0021CEAAB2|nr:EF-hand domain-containing protein [Kordiimonas aquimaris]
MRQSTLKLGAFIIIGLCVSGCASNRRDGPPELPPERKQALYDRLVTQWDYNQDDTITCADVTTVRTRLFDTLDTNKDGFLYPAEYRFAQFDDKSFLFFPFAKVDSDESSSISFTEFKDIPHSEFGGYDSNRDCIVTIDEAAAALRRFSQRPSRDKQADRKDVEVLDLPDY